MMNPVGGKTSSMPGMVMPDDEQSTPGMIMSADTVKQKKK
jgi:hypothetical protein